MKILLVEDEDRVASFIVKGLQSEGHRLDRVATVHDAIEAIASSTYDMVLLDLLLPDGNGRDVLLALRRSDGELPVIVLSALGETEDKVTLLDEGADDYLVKPFAFAELAARVRANARQGQRSSRVLTAGDLTLDTKSRTARCGPVETDLPAREFALLEYMMRHAGQVLTRQQLLDAIWGFDFDTGSNVVDVYVGYLRRKLDAHDSASCIETVRGAGYRVRT
ncbi:MAG: DNA-binding response regulator [Actinobacteria bacterium HGW-Actinobacteria-10]|nr:MAG: DNA-binding response regulator [Actinobacteria bacterium HGW-Actinobacteria-10]